MDMSGAISRVLAIHKEDKEELAEFMEDLKMTLNKVAMIRDHLMLG